MVLEAGESKMKLVTGLVSDKSPLPGSEMAAFSPQPHMVERGLFSTEKCNIFLILYNQTKLKTKRDYIQLQVVESIHSCTDIRRGLFSHRKSGSK